MYSISFDYARHRLRDIPLIPVSLKGSRGGLRYGPIWTLGPSTACSMTRWPTCWALSSREDDGRWLWSGTAVSSSSICIALR